MARYRKIDPRIWRDEKFVSLSAEEKLIAIYCLVAQSNRIGFFNFSPARAAEELDTLPNTFAKCFRKVCQTFQWGFDERLKVLLIPKWFRYNEPENRNVLVGNLKDLDELPDSALIVEFAKCDEELRQTYRQTFRERIAKRLANVTPNPPLSVAVAGTVTETVDKNISPAPAGMTCSGAKKSPNDHAILVAAWKGEGLHRGRASQGYPEVEKKIPALVNTFGVDGLKAAIRNYATQLHNKPGGMQFACMFSTFFGTKQRFKEFLPSNFEAPQSGFRDRQYTEAWGVPVLGSEPDEIPMEFGEEAKTH